MNTHGQSRAAQSRSLDVSKSFVRGTRWIPSLWALCLVLGLVLSPSSARAQATTHTLALSEMVKQATACALEYLSEELCTEIVSHYVGQVAGATSCSAFAQLVIDKKINLKLLARTASLEFFSNSESKEVKTVSSLAKAGVVIYDFQRCMKSRKQEVQRYRARVNDVYERSGEGVIHYKGSESTDHVYPSETITDVPGYLLLPAGTFLMGSPAHEADREENETRHTVEISKPFWLKKTPVTTGEWYALIGNRPSSFAESCGDRCPVEFVNWFEAVSYANRLSHSEGLTACYRISGCSGTLGGGPGDPYTCQQVSLVTSFCDGYRLPTEAEWEYAYRAGDDSAYYGSPDTIAWYTKNARKRTHPVGQKQPNRWGLYDMAGNVWEWCWDWYDENSHDRGRRVDPRGPSTGRARMLRGGSWFSDATHLRAARRVSGGPAAHYRIRGFRLAREALSDCPRPVAGRWNASRFSSVSGTESVVPSMA